MNCPIDYDKIIYKIQNMNKNQMITQNDSVISSQECVGLQAKLPPMILRSTGRPKIQDTDRSKIPMMWLQKHDTGRTPKMDRLAGNRKVRWIDNVETITATKMNRSG